MMNVYSTALKGQLLRFYRSLNESDWRRYAVLEAIRLGHGELGKNEASIHLNTCIDTTEFACESIEL